MVYFLIENPTEKQKFDFLAKSKLISLQLYFPDRKCNSMIDIVNFCNKCIDDTNNNDILICWYDFIGVILSILCRVKRKKRFIIILNILLKDKKTIKNKIVKILYKHALTFSNVEATVTSTMYGEYLNQMLGIKRNYTLLHDIYHEDYSAEFLGSVMDNSVFCGGRNGRNWDLLFKVAKELPEVSFNCVLTKKTFEHYQNRFSNNINAKYDIPENEFIQLLCESQLVSMPLDTNAPAGLIAFYQAAANGKLIITTDTPTTVEYFSNMRGVLCDNDIEEWKDAIRYYLTNKLERERIADSFRKFLHSECSEIYYEKTLATLVNNIMTKGEKHDFKN